VKRSILTHRLAFLLIGLAGLTTSPLLAQREKLPPDDREYVEKKWPDAKRTYTSLRYIVMKEGEKSGQSPTPGMMVTVQYKGMLLNGKVFDEADAAHPLVTRLGRGGLIDGWEEALQKMHKGDKWLLIVPPEMGYGVRGKPPTIPRDATLVFEMELVDFADK
jgi:FKBP-type peptidyl-prolyl cis-trans isomerase